MIHVFHGFLGSPKDFSFLKRKNDVVLHDLRNFEIDSMLDQFKEDDVLMGYSMGGRVAIELAVKLDFKIKKLILLAAHPGLLNDSEKIQRNIWENQVLAKLRSEPETFLSYWNGLDIFKNDYPLKISHEKLNGHDFLFDKYRLSRQENFLNHLQGVKDKVFWIIGNNDLKYMNMAKERLIPLEIKYRTMDGGGHRLYQHPEELLKILTEENIL